MDLVYYTPHKLYTYPRISGIDSAQVSFSQMFNAGISLIDRTETIKCPPMPIKNMYSLKDVTWQPNPASFEDICLRRFDDIINRADDEGKDIVLFYSGGIDSTLLVVLALMHPKFQKFLLEDRILLAFTEESIKENSKFWYSYILPNFRHHISDITGIHTLAQNDKNICITGEFADNIFGSLALKSYIDVTGDMNVIHRSFATTGKKWMLEKVSYPVNRTKCSELLDQVLGTSPRQLESNHDCFWWLNFILKWQAVNFRLASHSPKENGVNLMIKNLVHFFDTQEFQNWAVMTSEDKVQDTWYSYKLPAKQMIYKFNKDEYYYKWKTKYPSIPGLTRYTNMYDFIYYDSIKGVYVPSKELHD